MNDIFPVFTYADFAFVVLAAPASQARCASHCEGLCRLCCTEPRREALRVRSLPPLRAALRHAPPPRAGVRVQAVHRGRRAAAPFNALPAALGPHAGCDAAHAGLLRRRRGVGGGLQRLCLRSGGTAASAPCCALSTHIQPAPAACSRLRCAQGPELYQSAASATAAAALLGFLVAAEAGQLAVAGGASLTALFYASLVTVARARCSGSCCSALTLATLQGSGTALSFLLHADAPPPLAPDAPPLAQRTKQARLRSPLAIAML